MITSVHIADVGPAAAVTLRAPKSGTVPGLLRAEAGLAAPLTPKVLPSPQVGRALMVAFWDDDAALDRFLAGHAVAKKFAGGFHVRLEPLRVHGNWKGLLDGVPTGRAVPLDGPAAVITIGRLRLTQAVRFLQTSAKAESDLLQSDALIFASGFAKPPLVGTFSLWESTTAMSAAAYGHNRPGHAEAIAEGDRKEFHHESAFIRFRPYAAVGHLDGTNPLAASSLEAISATPA